MVIDEQIMLELGNSYCAKKGYHPMRYRTATKNKTSIEFHAEKDHKEWSLRFDIDQKLNRITITLKDTYGKFIDRSFWELTTLIKMEGPNA